MIIKISSHHQMSLERWWFKKNALIASSMIFVICFFAETSFLHQKKEKKKWDVENTRFWCDQILWNNVVEDTKTTMYMICLNRLHRQGFNFLPAATGLTQMLAWWALNDVLIKFLLRTYQMFWLNQRTETLWITSVWSLITLRDLTTTLNS